MVGPQVVSKSGGILLALVQAAGFQAIWGIVALVQSICRPKLDAVADMWGYDGHHHRKSHTITLVVSDKLFAWTSIDVTHKFR